LFEGGAAAGSAVEAAGIPILEVRDVLVLTLNQTEPGQLGRISRPTPFVSVAAAALFIGILHRNHRRPHKCGSPNLERRM